MLREAGYAFAIHPADLDEDALTAAVNLPADDLPIYLARAKAEAISQTFPQQLILAADTVVALGEQIIGKAADAEDARRILSLLSGSTHRVITGVVVFRRSDGLIEAETVSSTVEMNALSAAHIDDYLATNLWRGKAGAYGIQDTDTFVRRVSGCMTNIVGLPIKTTIRLLSEAGIPQPKTHKSG